MASNRQIKANRENAKRSTGPKTEAGKARSRRNALRHGLSRPISGPTDGEVRAATLDGIAKPAELARSRLDITRIFSARAALLEAFLNDPDPNVAKALLGINRYEAKAFAR